MNRFMGPSTLRKVHQEMKSCLFQEKTRGSFQLQKDTEAEGSKGGQKATCGGEGVEGRRHRQPQGHGGPPRGGGGCVGKQLHDEEEGEKGEGGGGLRGGAKRCGLQNTCVQRGASISSSATLPEHHACLSFALVCVTK